MLLRKVNVVPDDEKVVHVAHAAYDREFFFHARPECRRLFRVARAEALFREGAQIARRVRIALGNIVGGEFQFMEAYLDLAARGDFCRVLQSLGDRGKERTHLLLGL